MKKIYAALFLLLSIFLLGCYKGSAQQKEDDSSSILEVTYWGEAPHKVHYIIRDNETGYEYIVVVWSKGSNGLSVSITPRLGVLPEKDK